MNDLAQQTRAATPPPQIADATSLRKRLLNALLHTGHGRYYPHDLLRWFLSTIFVRFGLPAWETPPDDVRVQLDQALLDYHALVRREPPFKDVLGPLGSYKQSALGQFFTTWGVSSLLAQMSVPNRLPPSIERVCDPACGSGVMMLALCSAWLERFGPKALRRLAVTCIDIDPLCARMCGAQFLLNISVYNFALHELRILHGDALRPDRQPEVLIDARAAPTTTASVAVR